MLLAVAVLVLVWAAGVTWPASDRAILIAATVGTGAAPPPGWLLALAGLAIGAAGLALLGRLGLLGDRVPARVWAAAARATAAVLLFRAALGFVVSGVGAPRTGTAFAYLDARVYSPSCLVLGLVALAVLRLPDPGHGPLRRRAPSRR